MRSSLVSQAPLLLGIGLIIAGNSLLTTVVGLRLELGGEPRWVTGLVLSAYFLGFIAGALGSSALIRRVGHIRAFAVGSGLFGAAAVSFTLVGPPSAWFALRGLCGVSVALLFTATESWLNDGATRTDRGALLGAYVVIVQLALALGQAALPAIDLRSSAGFLIPAVAFCLALTPVALTSAAQPQTDKAAPRVRLGELLRLAPMSASGCLWSGLTTAALLTLGPLYGRELGLSTSGLAVFMATMVLGGAALPLPLGRLSDIVDRRVILGLVGLGLCSVSAVTWTMAAPGLLSLCLLTLLLGGLAFSIYPLALAHAADRVARERVLSTNATLLLLFSAGAAAGPLLGAAALDRLGPAGLFIVPALVGLLLVGEASLRLSLGRPGWSARLLAAMRPR